MWLTFHLRNTKGEYTYQFRASLGVGADNKYKFKYKTYKLTEEMTKMTNKQLKEHLKYEAYKFEQEVLSNNYISPTDITFEHFTRKWQTMWLEKEVSENTIALRLSSLNNHILPVLGHLRMDKISTMMLNDLMNNLTRKDGQKGKLSVSSKHEVHKVLVSIFSRAIEWQVITNNPMDGVTKPKEKRKDDKTLNYYNETEVQILLKEAQGELEHWKIFISLALATGMRRGELIGLEWKHVDLNNGTINIQQIISKTRKGIEIKAPKYNSKRLVSLPSGLIKELKSYKAYTEKEKSRLEHNNIESKYDWLFYNEDGNHFHPDTPTKWWNKFLKRKKIRHIRLHDLRHTSATLLIAQNVHAKIISERLGHAKINTTMDIYGHALPSVDREASEKINHLFQTIKY